MLVASTMLIASTMGATAFQKGLGAMHALAHPLGALYDAHHGLLNAILMPYVLKANYSNIKDKLSDLCRYLSIEKGAEGFIEWVLQMRADLDIPHTLRSIGLDDEQAAKIAQMAIEDPSSATNPTPLSVREYETLFRSAFEGAL